MIQATAAGSDSRWSRFLRAIEPWYNWGTVSVERMEGMHVVDGILNSEAEGDVRFFELQWFGIHVQIQIGRTPKREEAA